MSVSHHVWVSLSVGLTATLGSLPFAVAAGWIIERGRPRFRGPLQTLVFLPLVLPPVVTGYLLLLALSPKRPLGAALAAIGAPVAFAWLGAVVAAAVVGFPLFVMSITLALKAVDVRLETVARSLGHGSLATFFRVTLPLTWPGILAGAVLSFARGLGEFGATIVLAGHIPGETDTIPLAIYASLERPAATTQVSILVALSVALGFAAIVAARALDARWRRRLEIDR